MADDAQLIAQMVRYYEQRAPWHDWYMDYQNPHQMALRQRPILDHISSYIRAKRILEVACGTGNWTHLLAETASAIYAIDSSPAAIHLAREKLTSVKNVTLQNADAYNLCEETPRCDVIFAADWFSHIPKSRIRSFLDAVHQRTSARTGIFVDMQMIDFFQEEKQYVDDDNNRVSIRTLPDGSVHNVVKNFPNETELRNLFDPMTSSFEYVEFPELKRWLMIYQII